MMPAEWSAYSRALRDHQRNGSLYAFCDQPHPGGDAEAQSWCARFHRPAAPGAEPTYPICSVCGDELSDEGSPGRYYHPEAALVMVPGDAPTDLADHAPDAWWGEPT